MNNGISEKSRAFYNDPVVVKQYTEAPQLQSCEERYFHDYLRPGMSVLDIGVGGGRTTRFLAPGTKEYIGIDFSEAMIAACRECNPGIDLRVMNAADLHLFGAGSFDAVVFSYNGMGHLYPDAMRMKCLAECYRVLKKGGIFIFSLHNIRSLFLRPTRKSKSIRHTLEGVLDSIKINVQRCIRRLCNPAFWKGHGYLDTPENMIIYMTTPEHVIMELVKSGFIFVDYCGEEYPRKSLRFLTRWYYFVFKK